jgi:hypothetical protein
MGTNQKRWARQDWIVAAILFLATSAVVVWQNSRLTVLWDLSYILENSYRISLGDIPYRDFPFPYAPLTFLIQAALIKLTGRVFWHHIIYCAVIGGLASVITWRIVLHSLGDVKRARWLAFMFSVPLVPLGIYCVYPHPFYDSDCTLAILICVLLLQRLKATSSGRAFFTGVTLAIPLFVKQNTGLAFVASVVAALVFLIVIEGLNRRPVRGYVSAIWGALFGLGSALLVIHLTAGVQNYWQWTIRFAASRRMPQLTEMLSAYGDISVLLSTVAFAAGALALWLNRYASRVIHLLATVLMSAPFVWPVIYLLIEPEPSDRAERLLAVWPFMLIVSSALAIFTFKRRSGTALVLPFVLIAAAQGAFLSQQLWGSTYALWPLWIILVAGVIDAVSSFVKPTRLLADSISPVANTKTDWVVIPLTTVISLSMLIAGSFYVWSHERLDYAELSDGELAHSRLPALRGLSMRGDFIPGFEELVDYAEREIPPDAGVLMLPGEDLFYYTTGRRPRFQVLMFDRTINPYSADEIRDIARDRRIDWLIVKQEVQLEDGQVKQFRDDLLGRLEQDYEQVESLDNYEVYRRKPPEQEEDHQ